MPAAAGSASCASKDVHKPAAIRRTSNNCFIVIDCVEKREPEVRTKKTNEKMRKIWEMWKCDEFGNVINAGTAVR